MVVERDDSDIAFTYKGKRISIKFVADRTFFHDVFRNDYSSDGYARWFFSYLVVRKSLDTDRRIMAVPSTILDKISREFRSYPGVPATFILYIQAIAETYTMPSDIQIDFTPLYTAKILDDSGIRPLIISSVKEEKWIERIRKAGVDWNIDGFTESMSAQRIIEKAWTFPIPKESYVELLEVIDPIYYQKIIKIIGTPKRKGESSKH